MLEPVPSVCAMRRIQVSQALTWLAAVLVLMLLAGLPAVHTTDSFVHERFASTISSYPVLLLVSRRLEDGVRSA